MESVIPTEVGIHDLKLPAYLLDSRLHGNDARCPRNVSAILETLPRKNLRVFVSLWQKGWGGGWYRFCQLLSDREIVESELAQHGEMVEMHVALDDLSGLKAPDFGGGGPWVNSEPLSLKDLRGTPVLVDFWTYSCVNCLRTLPHMKEWYHKYSSKGLVVIGVHTPEFDFEKDVDNVLDFVRKEGIDYPIVLDNDHAIWDAYANRYWPRKLLVDYTGTIRRDHIGEGAYAETEDWIQRLLKETDPHIALPKIETVEHEHKPGALCYRTTPEVHGGYKRGVIGNADGHAVDGPDNYTDPGKYEDGKVYLHGTWEAKPQYVKHARKTTRPEDRLSLMYHALEVNTVMNPGAAKTLKVLVTRDGKSLDRNSAGADVVFENGKSLIVVDGPRMYRIVRDHEFGSHILTLATTSDQLQVYSFTFGGCKL